MIGPFDRLLDRILGPRHWMVVEDDGVAFAIHQAFLEPGDLIVRADLRRRAAFRLARRLRRQAEDRPEPLP